jgi:exopolysaccharide biosynthesis polyprenyl glycosylphosphotransferase
LAHQEPGHFEGESVISHYAKTFDPISLLSKRIIDIAVSSILLTLFSPLFLVVALLIKFSSPGPVFFIQERVGLNKRRFRLYKFRTMVSDAEQRQAELEDLNEVRGPVFKIKNDPRITPIGKFLRKTSMDELPQLFNVLKGDMSLVGPRPLPVRDYNGFDEDWHRRRFSVRPGITCLWQINGRSNIHFEDWMKLDMEYIDNWSLWLDLKIILQTVPAVLKGSGAS